MRKVVKRAVQMTTFVAIPLMAFLTALAKPIVVLLVGAKWSPSAPILQILCIVGALYPIHAININLLMALGRSDAVLRLQWIKMLMAVVGIAFTYQLGLLVMVWGMVATSVCALVVNTYYTKRDFNYDLRAQVGDMLPGLVVGLVTFLGASALTEWIDGPALVKIAVGGAWTCFSSLLALRFLPDSMKHEVDRILAKLPRGTTIKPWLLGGAYR